MDTDKIYLGIDYGKKRIGLAYSDASASVAVPHSVIPNDKKMFDTIRNIIREKHIKKIIVGKSLDSKGNPNDIQKHTDLFKEQIKSAYPHIEIIDQEEFFTSAHVEEKGDLLDASAAALILQRYLDMEKYKTSKIL